MTFPLLLFALLLLVAFAAYALLHASAAAIASTLRLAGPAVLALAGLTMMLVGRGGTGGVLLSLAAAWFGSTRLRSPRKKSSGQRSRVRTAVLEMELDHDTAGLEGTVLAGNFEGRSLAGMTLDELLELRREFSGDGESLQLLETYLDSRFAVWRDRVEPDENVGQGGSPTAGPMSKEEAYKVLGLQMGASATEIRQAHRRLMQRLHPDMGGSSSLAARINEARDVLLSDHG